MQRCTAGNRRRNTGKTRASSKYHILHKSAGSYNTPITHLEPLQVNVDIRFIDQTLRVADIRCELTGGPENHVKVQQLHRTVTGARASFVPTVPATYLV